MSGRLAAKIGLERFSGLYLWAAFIIVFGIWIPDLFLNTITMHVIASQQAVAGMVALALLIPMVCGHFDISVGSTANLCGMVAVVGQVEAGWSVPKALLVGTLIGCCVGIVNGFVITVLRVNSFIATLGMLSVLEAFQTIVTDNQVPLPVQSELWNSITQTEIFGFQIIIVYLLVLAFFLWWLLAWSPVGRYMYAVGENSEAARLAGLKVDRIGWLSLIASGGISGFAGMLYVSLTGPSISFGLALIFPAFAAVFFGSTQLVAGRYNVWGTLLAIFVLATGVQGLQLATGVQWVNSMFNGVALIVAVALAVSRDRDTAGARRLARRFRLRPAVRTPEPLLEKERIGSGTSEMTDR